MNYCAPITAKAPIEEPDRITGRARQARISIVEMVEVRLKKLLIIK